MSKVSSGVYPVYEHQFQISTTGRATGETGFVDIADMETFSVSFDDNVEEWTPMTTEGWVRRLKTGKGLTIGLNGKRNIGDAGNDYIAGLPVDGCHRRRVVDVLDIGFVVRNSS